MLSSNLFHHVFSAPVVIPLVRCLRVFPRRLRRLRRLSLPFDEVLRATILFFLRWSTSFPLYYYTYLPLHST